jgi:Putative MetA-pathway of phenol degradation
MKRLAALTALLLLALPMVPAHAQTQAPADASPPAAAPPDAPQAVGDLCADRPGKATPPCILDAGHAQLEVGLADAVFQHSNGQHETLYTVSAGELRVGLTPSLEVEASWAPLIIDHQRGASDVSGTGDLTFGFRHALTAPGGDGAQVSIQAYVTAPTATNGLGAGGWTGGARLPVAVPLAKDLGLGLTPEVDVVRNASGGGTHLAWSTAAGISRAFGKFTLGVEAWGQIDDDPRARTYQASADFTAARTIGENTQLDAGLYIGLNRQTPDAEAYVGLSHRF